MADNSNPCASMQAISSIRQLLSYGWNPTVQHVYSKIISHAWNSSQIVRNNNKTSGTAVKMTTQVDRYVKQIVFIRAWKSSFQRIFVGRRTWYWLSLPVIYALLIASPLERPFIYNSRLGSWFISPLPGVPNTGYTVS